mmetsp:Transcript_26612/g.57747  ORF Transcript_26612/g.57747 Transcript_26612/m.57747 type:complete len:593 (-) Transcript_26612:178-1956(-)
MSAADQDGDQEAEPRMPNGDEAPLSDNDDDDSDLDDDAFDELEDYDGVDLIYYSLCSPREANFTALEDALRYDKENHGFDLLAVLPSASTEDFYESAIICINMSRKFVANFGESENRNSSVGRSLKSFLATHFNSSSSNTNDDNDQYYKPVLADDAFLMTLDDLEDLKRKTEGLEVSGEDGTVGGSNETNDDKVQQLEEQVSSLQRQLDRAKELITSLTLEDGGFDNEDKANMRPAPEKQDNDSYYFSSYSTHYIHETMLKDTVRTEAYETAILSNSETLFKDKVVLDIGCGTGVLSIFAAKGGAKKVIAVDGSAIIHDARNIIDLNGYGGKIICCQGMLETLLENNDLPLEPDEKVDVIVSEWMGYALFFETMLPSVMKARDALMAPNGTMYPNAAQIFLEGASDPRLDYWENVHGIDMTPMKTRVAKELVKDAGVEVVDVAGIVTDRVKLAGFDLNTCKDCDLDFSVPFALQCKAPADGSSFATTRIDKLVVSFDIDFDVPGTNPVSFSTGCQSTPTHWKQAVLWFDPVVGVPTLTQGETLRGQFKMGRNAKNHREMDFDVTWEVVRLKGGENGDFIRQSSGRIETKLGA